MSDVAIEIYNGATVAETITVAGSSILEVPATVPGAYTEILVPGPQGVPGDTRFWIGNTPPADTSMIWVDTSI